MHNGKPKINKKIPVKDLYIEAPKYIINIIKSDGIILFTFFLQGEGCILHDPNM